MADTEDYSEGGALTAHHTSHENGGSDEVTVQGLSGLLADGQTPLAHKTSHQDGGADEISVTGLAGLLVTAQTPAAHNTSHQLGGADAMKLDDLAAPDDTTDLNASTAKHGLAPKGTAGTAQFWRQDWTLAAPSGASVLVQKVYTQTGAEAHGTGLIPRDDTIPQKTEGDEYMTLAITPTKATNRLDITVIGIWSNSVARNPMVVALFRDDVADALAGITWDAKPNASDMDASACIIHHMVAGTTSEITFKVRAGGNQTGTTTFNGAGAARYLGGVMASSITIEEVAV
jgi:hypothetical protein